MHALPSDFSAERGITFDEAMELMRVEGEYQNDKVRPPENSIEDPLTDTPTSDAIDLRSSLRGNFTTITERCSLYDLEIPTNVEGVFRIALRKLKTLDKHRQEFNRLMKAQG